VRDHCFFLPGVMLTALLALTAVLVDWGLHWSLSGVSCVWLSGAVLLDPGAAAEGVAGAAQRAHLGLQQVRAVEWAFHVC
jgi:hypothetical protein